MSDNLYYKYIRLDNGENLICTTDNNCLFWYDEKVISIINPVVVTSARFPKGDVLVESYILYSWNSFTKDDVIEIPVSKIMVIFNPSDGLIKNYEEFIMQKNKEHVETSVDSDDEDLFRELLESLEGEDIHEESETGEGSSARGNTRILH